MLAGAAVAATNSAASAVVSQMVIRLFAGNFNPAYKKVPRRKMRYIQMKYMLAYQSSESGDDPRAIIGGIGKGKPDIILFQDLSVTTFTSL